MKNRQHIYRRGLTAVAAIAAVAASAAAFGSVSARRAFADDAALAEPDVRVNALRASDDGALDAIPADIMYGGNGDIAVPRPEHGDTVVFKFTAHDDTFCEFAAKFDASSNVKYYEVTTVDGKPAADIGKPISDNYDGGLFKSVIDDLDAGVYVISAYVPEYDVAANGAHTHWWESGAPVTDNDAVYAELNAEYVLEVLPFNIEQNDGGAFAWQFKDGANPSVEYDGTADNVPELTVTFNGAELVRGVDYTVSGSSANVGESDLIISGLGNYGGEIVSVGAYTVTVAQNDWAVGGAPAAIAWHYGAFVDGVNGFEATPKFLDDGMSVIYTVTYDGGASEIVEGLGEFVVSDGRDGAELAAILNELDAGTYYLTARVEETVNYTAVEPYTVRFDVLVADNSWNVTPYIMQWNYGGYDKTLNVIEAEARYADENNPVRFTVSTDAAGKDVIGGLSAFVAPDGVVSDDVAAALAELDAGLYYLTSTVRATDNYGALAPAAMKFRISKAANYWDEAPTIAPWIVGEYDAIANKLVATPHFGSARVVVRDTTADSNIVFDPDNGVGALGDLAAGTYILTVTVDGTDNYSALEYSGIFRVSVPETELIKRGLPWWGTVIIVLGALGIAAGILIILHVRGVFKMTSAKALDDYKLEQTQKVVAAAVHASKLDAERKAEAEAREREMEEQKAKAEATAVEAEEVSEAAAALDAAPETVTELDTSAAAGEQAAQAEAETAAAETPKPKKSGAKKTSSTSKAKSGAATAKAKSGTATAKAKSGTATAKAKSGAKKPAEATDGAGEKTDGDAAEKPVAAEKKPAAKKKPSPKKM